MVALKKITLVVLLCIFILHVLPSLAIAEAVDLSEDQSAKIEAFVQKEMKKGNIPGMSVVLIKEGKELYKKGYGFADLQTKEKVNTATLFELGSTTKAFTSLAVLKLEREGKLSLNDPVDKYIPWFAVQYKGIKARITINQLLRHTSGIPFSTITDIPQGSDDESLERTVRKLIGVELVHAPGGGFNYATINYSVLGLIVQIVSGESYEAYMKSAVLSPLGLSNTYLFRQEAIDKGMASGYKLGFSKPRKYEAPVHRGNTPGGFIISNADDMETWLKVQMGAIPNSEEALIKQTQTPEDSSGYGMGWYQDAEKNVYHYGANSNFSSFIMLNSIQKTGVAVLANISSDYTEIIGRGIISILHGQVPLEKLAIANEFNQSIVSMDKMSYATTVVAIVVSILIFLLLFIVFRQIIQGKRLLIASTKKRIIGFITGVALFVGIGLGLYILYHNFKLMNLSLSFIFDWGPVSLLFAVYTSVTAFVLICGYFYLTYFYPKSKEKPYLLITCLSLMSGLGNASIIFIISKALSSDQSKQFSLMIYFVFGIMLYIFSQRFVRSKLIKITNENVFEKRAQLIQAISKASFQKLERLEDGKIQAVLNNDTEAVSRSANIFIGFITQSITLVFCFIYLAVISFYGFLISLFVVLLAGGLFLIVSGDVNKHWERNRDIQNMFFKFIDDLIKGFKELYIHRPKQTEFQKDMILNCDEFRHTRVKGEMKLTNVGIIGELLFVTVIGVVVFLFPILFREINKDNLTNYVFVFLYMTGPVNGILSSIPAVLTFRISWKRITDILQEIELAQRSNGEESLFVKKDERTLIELYNVTFRYTNESGEVFTIGPINYKFRSGEIVFITGGNGSGKSTLAKLITGLYIPESGEIRVNGQQIDSRELGQYFSAIFSDFHLFDKLYGLDYQLHQETIQTYLKLLQIDDKVQIINGKFTSFQLSTGQKKRLALLLSFLEDRPIYLFDEWAADQDPEFRKFFYYTLLPELKERGKCILAVTHDDAYFHVAEHILKMDMGQIVA